MQVSRKYSRLKVRKAPACDIEKYLMFLVSTHHFLEHHRRIRYNRTKNGTVPERKHIQLFFSAKTKRHLTTNLIPKLFLYLKIPYECF